MLEALREEVLEANLELVRRGLVLYTFGNASGIDRAQGLVVIKPSGVPYEGMRPHHLVVTDLNGKIIEGEMRPSSDLPTHLRLYQEFEAIGGVVHTHSHYATCWAQSRKPIPCLGTTHGDYFYGSIPVTAPMDASEIRSDYEWNTGEVIARTFRGFDSSAVPAVLVAGHAPFCWGATVAQAARNAVILEEVARMALHTLTINATADAISQDLLDKHFRRKHGPEAYYGQPG